MKRDVSGLPFKNVYAVHYKPAIFSAGENVILIQSKSHFHLQKRWQVYNARHKRVY